MSVLDNALQTLFKLGIEVKKVWENASPTSGFAAQGINIGTSNYDFAMILHQSANVTGGKDVYKRQTLIEGDTNCDMVQIQYAAYLFRRRGGEETSMPRFLRYELNNLLFSQKGRIDT